MIGGKDIVIPSRVPYALDASMRSILRYWPEAVIENGATGDRIAPANLAQMNAPCEILVYRDEQIAADWEAHGAQPALVNTMVHLLADANSVTVVVDDERDPAIAELIRGIYIALTGASLNGAPMGNLAAVGQTGLTTR